MMSGELPGPGKEGHMSVSVLVPDGATYELAEHVATELTTGLGSSSLQAPQGGNTGVTNDEPPGNASAAAVAAYSPVQLARALWTMALLTLTMDIATALYRPAKGVVFGRSKLAYYLALAVIFAAGLAEAFAAFCLSCHCSFNSSSSSSSSSSRRRLSSLGRAALCASVLPFVAVVAIGGFAFMEG